MQTSIFSDAHWLRTENQGYGQLPIPRVLDHKIHQVISKWIDLNENARKEAAKSIQESQRFAFLAFSERMASLAVRKKSTDLIFTGLVALGVDGWRYDWRDNVLLLALHYDAALKLGIEPNVVFDQAAMLMDNEVAEGIRSFPRRSKEDKSLEAMGYREGNDDDGFRYMRTW